MPGPASAFQPKPTAALMPIRTTDVGVATFSVMRSRNTSSANVAMSRPEPVIDVITPPTTPVTTSSTPCRGRKFVMPWCTSRSW